MCTYRESQFHFPVTCPSCGSNVAQINGSHHAGTEALAIVRCVSCSREFSVSVLLRNVMRPPAAAERKRDQRARAKANA